MKQYPKTYENVFSTDSKTSLSKKLYIDKISARRMKLDKYDLLLKEFLTDFYSKLFYYSVRLSWLRRKFKYYGKKTVFPLNRNSILHNMAFVKYLRRNIGKDIQLITRSKFFSKLELYFDEMFPGFDEGDPFENPDYYKFPFENISIDFLLTVYQLEDRMELLKYADKKNMSYAVFVDYVINRVLSINEELGRDRYQMKLNTDRNFPFYVKDTDKGSKTKKKKI